VPSVLSFNARSTLPYTPGYSAVGLALIGRWIWLAVTVRLC
jgi:hypothetical protein